MSKTGYTKPRLYDYAGEVSKEWYVGFRHTCPHTQIRKPFQIRGGINYAETITQRREEGNALARLVGRCLDEGWNPHQEDFKVYLLRVKTPEHCIEMMPVGAALEYAFSKKTLAKKSANCVRVVKDFAVIAAKKIGLDQMAISEFRRKNAKALLEQIEKDRTHYYKTTTNKRFKGITFTGNSYNKFKRYLQSLFVELVEYEAIDHNPFDRIKDRAEVQTKPHRHATEKEVAVIKAHLRAHYPTFFVYLNCEYQTGIRPNELFGLRVRDYDVLNQCFHVQPVEGGSKTRQARMVPVPNSFMPYLEQLELANAGPDDHIFSVGFRPGPERQPRDRATKLWREVVKDGLGINVSLYSFKGLGGEDKRDAGIDAEAVQSQYGHSRMSTTRLYIPREQDRIHQQIRERTRDL